MKTLSVEEAVNGLGNWLELAIAGEDIRIRKGAAVVELRPVREQAGTAVTGASSPQEALRQLQAEARLEPCQAREYLEELMRERLAASSPIFAH